MSPLLSSDNLTDLGLANPKSVTESRLRIESAPRHINCANSSYVGRGQYSPRVGLTARLCSVTPFPHLVGNIQSVITRKEMGWVTATTVIAMMKNLGTSETQCASSQQERVAMGFYSFVAIPRATISGSIDRSSPWPTPRNSSRFVNGYPEVLLGRRTCRKSQGTETSHPCSMHLAQLIRPFRYRLSAIRGRAMNSHDKTLSPKEA